MADSAQLFETIFKTTADLGGAEAMKASVASVTQKVEESTKSMEAQAPAAALAGSAAAGAAPKIALMGTSAATTGLELGGMAVAEAAVAAQTTILTSAIGTLMATLGPLAGLWAASAALNAVFNAMAKGEEDKKRALAEAKQGTKDAGEEMKEFAKETDQAMKANIKVAGEFGSVIDGLTSKAKAAQAAVAGISDAQLALDLVNIDAEVEGLGMTEGQGAAAKARATSEAKIRKLQDQIASKTTDLMGAASGAEMADKDRAGLLEKARKENEAADRGREAQSAMPDLEERIAKLNDTINFADYLKPESQFHGMTLAELKGHRDNAVADRSNLKEDIDQIGEHEKNAQGYVEAAGKMASAKEDFLSKLNALVAGINADYIKMKTAGVEGAIGEAKGLGKADSEETLLQLNQNPLGRGRLKDEHDRAETAKGMDAEAQREQKKQEAQDERDRKKAEHEAEALRKHLNHLQEQTDKANQKAANDAEEERQRKFSKRHPGHNAPPRRGHDETGAMSDDHHMPEPGHMQSPGHMDSPGHMEMKDPTHNLGRAAAAHEKLASGMETYVGRVEASIAKAIGALDTATKKVEKQGNQIDANRK